MSQRVLILGADNVVGQRATAVLTKSTWANPIAVNDGNLPALLETADCVISCVMGKPAAIENSARILFTGVKSLTNPPRIIHVSSMTVYGAAAGVINEDAPLQGDLGAYSAARVAAEALAADCSRVVTLRPGCEYGPDCTAWSERVARWLMSKRLGDLGAAGDGYCNLLFIDDLVNAIVASAQRDEIEGQAFNLATSESLTWNDYFIRFAKTLGAVPVKRISGRRLRLETRLMAPPLKVLELAIGSGNAKKWGVPSAIPSSLLGTCGQALKLNVGKAESLLGMHWTPVDDGLARTAAWIRNQPKL